MHEEYHSVTGQLSRLFCWFLLAAISAAATAAAAAVSAAIIPAAAPPLLLLLLFLLLFSLLGWICMAATYKGPARFSRFSLPRSRSHDSWLACTIRGRRTLSVVLFCVWPIATRLPMQPTESRRHTHTPNGSQQQHGLRAFHCNCHRHSTVTINRACPTSGRRGRPPSAAQRRTRPRPGRPRRQRTRPAACQRGRRGADGGKQTTTKLMTMSIRA